MKKSLSMLTAWVEIAWATCMAASTFLKESSVIMRPKSAMSSVIGRASFFSRSCQSLTLISLMAATVSQPESVCRTSSATASMSSGAKNIT